MSSINPRSGSTFKTEAIAEESSLRIYELFLDYLENDDFVVADMARKYLQMGFTRAWRYANYKGGRKYDREHAYKQLEQCVFKRRNWSSAGYYWFDLS